MNSTPQPYIPGQRWLSSMEPELGLGVIQKVDNRIVVVNFPAAETVRNYAADSAPLKRVEFQPGDTIHTVRKEQLTIEKVIEENGLFIYSEGKMVVSESDLISVQSVSSPLPRLLSGHYDFPRIFSLRYKTLKRRYEWLSSMARGFEGCRVSLIPHQLDVAYETATRPLPRVLLADEVGLGKTIEAGLILHRLLLIGRINRVLIIVPEALTVQWFIELYRRFHLSFTLVGDHPLKKELGGDEDENADFHQSLCLASIEGLLSHPKWIKAALGAKWDMVLFDEAHHLSELPNAYPLAQGLAAKTPGLLLLTATPESVGLEAHFKRLQLLDPARYANFELFQKQRTSSRPVAELAARLMEKTTLSPADLKILEQMDIDINDDHDSMVHALVDRHGEGRAVFRNTRAHVPGFPERIVNLYPLIGTRDLIDRIGEEVEHDINQVRFEPELDNDPRVEWLITWLQENPDDKALLICRSSEKAVILAAALEKKISFNSALFHENMTLLQRDRQAAWFSAPQGARLLIASEIGGEGRNFQFAHHLIFFDCPLDPEKVEQRIGRLDRIGQRDNVYIHIPYIKKSGQAVIIRWLHEGLDGFSKAVPGGHSLYLQFRDSLLDLLSSKSETNLKSFLDQVRSERDRTAKLIHEGRDRLLELGSSRPERARQLHESMETLDSNPKFHKWTRKLLDHFGIKADPLLPDTWQLDFELLNMPALPLPRGHEKGVTATFNRSLAQEREDWIFLTSEHPLIEAASTLLLESESGNASVAVLDEPGFRGMVLETVFILECLAPQKLFADRFLPPTPIHGFIDHTLASCDQKFPTPRLKTLKPSTGKSLDNQILRDKIREMADTAEEQAERKAEAIIREALKKMNGTMESEIERLISLAKVNPSVKRDEIEVMVNEKADLQTAVSSARVRLDAIRLILPV